MPGQRIVVTGGTGSGKSTLAATLADYLGTPFVELDALFWEPDWTESADEIFFERVREATAGDQWVIAGNYHRTHGLTWPRADTVIFLDYPLHITLPRLLRRSWRRWRTKEMLWGTNRERFWPHFYSRDSLFIWAIRSRAKLRQSWLDVTTDPAYSHIRFIRLCSPAEAARWLGSVAPAHAQSTTRSE